SFEPGRIELRTAEGAPRDLLGTLKSKLFEWTGERWSVSYSSEQGERTLQEQEEAQASQVRQEVLRNPVVKAVMDSFPGAEIQRISTSQTLPGDAPGEVAAAPDEAAGEQEER
ncbi:MAG: DNA polymerase III subunit gamma/tau, partial [Rhodovibrionaceae bacterium]